MFNKGDLVRNVDNGCIYAIVRVSCVGDNKFFNLVNINDMRTRVSNPERLFVSKTDELNEAEFCAHFRLNLEHVPDSCRLQLVEDPLPLPTNKHDIQSAGVKQREENPLHEIMDIFSKIIG